ncbi:drug/metabolite transporter (DMT)-like permease [Thermocatellispora tengchongensis]|uniref:Drug/metabolite transporter (DMT)-like permease n=1 Tax=Thermocatellispora tengchongensis TaxID=1073253 RepID=A0A840P3M0_9ACTN|nr:DMT family transporter [Thermocatellispora tengchongensis]MBB5132493.1 drug/metabolite transporter (DMT)-like permease [Thermocatellispora tengchongensis]
MTAVVLATACAVVYGTADFLGGLATKRSQVFAVVALSQLAGLAFVLALLPVLPGSFSPGALLWGMSAGLAGAAGLVLFYWALANGVMSVVAPATATMSAAVPVAYGLAVGERPEPVALAGVVVAITAVLLVSRDPSAGASRSTLAPLLAALVSGAGFGGFFILLSHAPQGTGLWPLLGARVASITVVVLLALATRRALRPGRGSLRVIAAAGVLDMAANVLYLFAAQQGLLSLVAVLVSLYPASTLVLARYVLGERLHPVQIAGVVAALVAVGLIATA